MANQLKCPCGTGREYNACCEIAHKDIMNVKTAEQLMRSRYSAYVMTNSDYLNQSHHSKTRPQTRNERRETIRWAKSVKWIGLEIVNKLQGSEGDTYGVVEFKAKFTERGLPSMIHEKSTFEKENGHWVYKDAL